VEFLTAEDIAEILKTTPEFVYKNRTLLGGIKIGRLVRFPKSVFESIMGRMNDERIQASGQVDVRLFEERDAVQGRRLRDQERSPRRGGKGKGNSKADKYGLYEALRESVTRNGDEAE
jgi:uncharacterized protein YigA (DUF484 family)